MDMAQPYEPLHVSNENAGNSQPQQMQQSQNNTALSNDHHQQQQQQQPPVQQHQQQHQQQQFYPIMQQQQQQQQQPQCVIPTAQLNQAPYMVAAQPGPTQIHPIVVQVPRQRTPPTIKENYKSRSSKILGIIQLVAGAFALILNCIGFGIQASNDVVYYNRDDGTRRYSGSYYFYPSWAYYGFIGIWGYIFFALSGSFAIRAAARKTKCTIVAHMVLAIIASVFAFLMLGLSLWAFGDDFNRLKRGFDDDAWYYDSVGNSHYESWYVQDAVLAVRGGMAVSTFWVLASLLELVACIWSSTLGCRVMCCAQNASTTQPSAQYAANAGPSGAQVLVLDSQGRPLPGAQVIQVPTAGGQGYGVHPTALATQPYIYPVQQGGATATPQGTAMDPPPYKS